MSEANENRIERLKERSKHAVCKYCGHELSLRHIVFSDINEAKVELYCNNCKRIEFGVEKEIYTCASNFVDNLDYDYYENMDDNESKRQMNIAKVCEIMGWACKNLDIMNDKGFTVPVSANQNSWNECLVVPSSDIK